MSLSPAKLYSATVAINLPEDDPPMLSLSSSTSGQFKKSS